ncbi:MAG: response regulator, partial [Deltaproteobacteria bacterium]
MTAESRLKNKMILVVDDEQDVLDIVSEVLDMCVVHKARDYDTAMQYLLMYVYDIVVLDIMGVRGFDLLRTSVTRGFPTVMLTAHAL